MSQPRQSLCASVAACLGGLALLASVARADALSSLPPVVGVTELYVVDELSGVALDGYDPVSYFLGAGPKPGLPEYELVWSGVAWRFATPANREAFRRDPETYAPRFGGYDAEAVARGLTVRANPWLSVVRSDGLYLFRSDHDRARFVADPRIAQRASERWASLKSGLVQP
jgi:hypothetical protein